MGIKHQLYMHNKVTEKLDPIKDDIKNVSYPPID